MYQLEALRENKPSPNTAIRKIRISDFGLPDPKRDPDRHQNYTTWSLSHALPLQKISSKSVHKFASNPTDRQTNRQTDRQTDRTKNITSFFGGGNNSSLISNTRNPSLSVAPITLSTFPPVTLNFHLLDLRR